MKEGKRGTDSFIYGSLSSVPEEKGTHDVPDEPVVRPSTCLQGG